MGNWDPIIGVLFDALQRDRISSEAEQNRGILSGLMAFVFVFMIRRRLILLPRTDVTDNKLLYWNIGY